MIFSISSAGVFSLSLGISLLVCMVVSGKADIAEQADGQFVENGADGQQDIAQHGFTFFHFFAELR